MSRRRRLRGIRRRLANAPLAITPDGLAELHAQLEARAGLWDTFETPAVRVEQGVAIVPVWGTLFTRPNAYTALGRGSAYSEIAAEVTALARDGSIRAIVLDVHSSGGVVFGCAECAEAIHAAARLKNVVAVANPLACSAAYHLAAAAREVVATTSSRLGSIGVLLGHLDVSAALARQGLQMTYTRMPADKALGMPEEPLSAEARAQHEQLVGECYAMFRDAVAAYRNLTAARVEEIGARDMPAADAVRLGLADRIGTLEGVLAELAAPQSSSAGGDARYGARAAGSSPVVVSARPAAPGHTEALTMRPEILALLVRLGACQATADESTARAALAALFAGRGTPLPDSDQEIVAALEQLVAAPQQQTTPPVVTEPPQPPDNAAQLTQAQQAGALAERARINEIRAAGALLSGLGLSTAAVDAAVEGGMSVEAARASFATALAQTHRVVTTQATSGQQVGNAREGYARFWGDAEVALASRCGLLAAGAQLTPAARALAAQPLLQLLATSLSSEGINTAGMDPHLIARVALGEPQAVSQVMMSSSLSGGVQTTGAFPHVLGNLHNVQWDGISQYTPATYRRWTQNLPAVRDFKEHFLVALGEFRELPLVPEGKPVEQSSTTEERASYKVDKYGDYYLMTIEMVFNDELGAFMDQQGNKLLAADLTLNRLAVDLVAGNPTLPDGSALFVSGNNWIDSAGGPPSVAEISKVRQLLRTQTGPSGLRTLNLPPRTLLVPTTLETAAQQVLFQHPLSVQQPTDDDDVNVFRGTLDLVVEAMFDAVSEKEWYALCDSRLSKTIVWCAHTSTPAPVQTSEYEFDTGSRKFKTEWYVGVGIRSRRGIAKNKGEN